MKQRFNILNPFTPINGIFMFFFKSNVIIYYQFNCDKRSPGFMIMIHKPEISAFPIQLIYVRHRLSMYPFTSIQYPISYI